jgi:hypothetical protein
MLRTPHCLQNRLTDGGDVVSRCQMLLAGPTPINVFYVSGINFC